MIVLDIFAQQVRGAVKRIVDLWLNGPKNYLKPSHVEVEKENN